MKKGLVTALIGAAAYCAGALFLPWQSYDLAQLKVSALEVHWLAPVSLIVALALMGVAGWGLATGRKVAAARGIIAAGLVLVAWLVAAQLNRQWGLHIMMHESVTMGLGFVVALGGALLAFGGGATSLALAPRWDEATPVLRVRATPELGAPREVIVYEPREVSLSELGLDVREVSAVRLTPECEVRLDVLPATRVVLEGTGRRVAQRHHDQVRLSMGDRALVDLGALELRFDYVRQERHAARKLVLGSEAVGFALVVLLVFLALGVGTILGWDEDAKRLLPDEERRTATIAALTEEERKLEPEVPAVIETALLESPQSSKAAGGPEGKFGDPTAPPERPTKIPPRDGAKVKSGFDVQKTGILEHLNDPRLAIMDDFADQGAFAARIASATTGNDDTWSMGPGTNGLGIQLDGLGGPGTDGDGRMLAQGVIDGPGQSPNVLAPMGPKPPRRVPPVIGGGGVVSGEYCKKSEIASAVARRAGLIKSCYEAQLQVKDGLKGKLTVRWMIGLDGSVMSADAVSDTIGDMATTQCVLRAVRKIKFAAPDGGTCMVSWPFVFSPG